MRYYVLSNYEVLWAMKERFDIKDNVYDLQLFRETRIVRSDASRDKTWTVPDDWDLT